MPVTIPYELIKEIAGELDMGMKCFYHIPTGQIKNYPDELKGHAGFDDEFWQDIINEVDSARQEYIAFEGMESYESFRLMENFVADIPDKEIRSRLEDALSFKSPFQNFKQLLNQYPELLRHWFQFKDQHLAEWVLAQLEVYNASTEKKEDSD